MTNKILEGHYLPSKNYKRPEERNYSIGKGTEQCKYCDTWFERNRKWQEFCSRTCKNRYHSERRNKAMQLLEEKEKAGK